MAASPRSPEVAIDGARRGHVNALAHLGGAQMVAHHCGYEVDPPAAEAQASQYILAHLRALCIVAEEAHSSGGFYGPGGGLGDVVKKARELHKGAPGVAVADLFIEVGFQRGSPGGMGDDVVPFPALPGGEPLHLGWGLQAVIEDVPVVLLGLLHAPGFLQLRD